jgi:hypothetical protein
MKRDWKPGDIICQACHEAVADFVGIEIFTKGIWGACSGCGRETHCCRVAAVFERGTPTNEPAVNAPGSGLAH